MTRPATIAGIVASLLLFSAIAGAEPYVYPDTELLNSQFGTEPWGSGSLDACQALSGQGVRFWITLGTAADNGKTVLGDDWPVAATAGLAWDDGGGYAQPHDNVSMAAWDRIELIVRYVSGPGPIAMKLFMNTGLTGPSGYPSNDWRNNTAWVGSVEALAVGDLATLVLDFDNAQGWGIEDNPLPHTAAGLNLADGTWYSVNDRDRREVTNMGFEVYDASGMGADAAVVVDANIVPEPGNAILLAAVGAAFLICGRRSCRNRA